MKLEGPNFEADQPAYRGNLHCHTTESDGKASPASVMADYRRLGYDFLALSDHDLLVHPKGDEIPEGLTMILALEASVGPHILCFGITETLLKTSDRQAVIDRVKADGGVTVLNHPNWGRSFSHWDQPLIESLVGYVGIEIYNGVIEVLEGSPHAQDRWDRLLTKGKRCWGFAHDDSHSPEGIGLGWIVVQAQSNTPEALLQAIREGRFYSSTGTSFTRYGLEGETLVACSPDADRLRFVSQHGRLVAQADQETGTFWYRGEGGIVSEPLSSEGTGIAAQYAFRGDEGYVRCEALGSGGRAAWSQPFWVSS